MGCDGSATAGPQDAAAFDIRDWKEAGGYGPDTLSHGNWTVYDPGWGPSRTDPAVCGVVGQYSYRNMPIYEYGYNCDAGNLDSLPERIISIAYTKPKVRTHFGEPAFKTPKLLKGRAIVMDACTKKGDGTKPSGGVTVPGFANNVHADGYNVLYGNYNTRWYSDTEKRIIYWDVSQLGGVNAPFAGLWTTTSFAYVKNGVNNYGVDQTTRNLGLSLVWHTLDQAEGIDLGTAADD